MEHKRRMWALISGIGFAAAIVGGGLLGTLLVSGTQNSAAERFSLGLMAVGLLIVLGVLAWVGVDWVRTTKQRRRDREEDRRRARRYWWERDVDEWIDENDATS